LVENGTVLEAMTWRYNFAMVFLLCAAMTRTVKIKGAVRTLKKSGPSAVCYLAFMILQAAGLEYATSVESGIAFAMIPIFAAVISAAFLKEKPRGVQIAFMLLSIGALVAMILFGASSRNLHVFGMAVSLLSSLAMAGSNVLMRFTRDTLSPVEIPAVIVITGFLLFNAASFVHGLAFGNLSSYFAPLAHSGFTLAAAYLGIVCIFITAALMSYMTTKIAVYKATIFGNLSTAVSIVVGAFVLNESVYWYHILFTALVIVGVIGVSASRAKKTQQERE
jgi:drug/metabolite transporter (DMT)-like permease